MPLEIFGSEIKKLSLLLSVHWTLPVIALTELNVVEPPATNILVSSSERAPAAPNAAPFELKKRNEDKDESRNFDVRVWTTVQLIHK